MKHLYETNDDDERRKQRIQSRVQQVFQERMSRFLDNTKSGQQTQNRFEQAQHLTGISYLAVSAIYSAMAGATVRISEPNKPKGIFGKAFATPGSTGRDSETKPLPDNHPAVQLFEYVNSQDTLSDLLTDWVIQECLHGVTHLWANPNIFGTPVELWCIPSSLIRYQGGPNEQYPTGYFVVNWYQAGGWSNSIAHESGVIEIASEEILVSKLKHPIWKWDGYSPLTAGGIQLDLLESIDIARKAAMEKGGINGGIISVSGATQDQLEDLEVRYRQKHAGPYNSGTPLFVDGERVTAASLGGNARDMDYPTAWKDMTGYALSLFNVPPAIIQSANSNYAQLYASLRQFYTFNLQPRAHRYAQFLQKHLVRPHWGEGLTVQIDLPKLDDPELQHQMFTAAPSSAWTINEYRLAHGHEPIEGGDVSAAEFDARVQAKVQKETQPQPAMPGMPQPGTPDAGGQPDDSGKPVNPFASLAGPQAPTPEVPTPENTAAKGSKGPQLKAFKAFLSRELKGLGKRFYKADNPWRQQIGPRGGKQWVNTQTGEIDYREHNPGESAAAEPTSGEAASASSETPSGKVPSMDVLASAKAVSSQDGVTVLQTADGKQYEVLESADGAVEANGKRYDVKPIGSGGASKNEHQEHHEKWKAEDAEAEAKYKQKDSDKLAARQKAANEREQKRQQEDKQLQERKSALVDRRSKLLDHHKRVQQKDELRDHEDTQVQQKRDNEDKEIERRRDKEDDDVEKAEKAEIASLEKRSKEADKRREKEDKDLVKRRDKEDDELTKTREKHDKDKEKSREAEDKEIKQRRNKERKTLAAKVSQKTRDKEDEAIRQQRDKEDAAIKAKRDQEDVAAGRPTHDQRWQRYNNARAAYESHVTDVFKQHNAPTYSHLPKDVYHSLMAERESIRQHIPDSLPIDDERENEDEELQAKRDKEDEELEAKREKEDEEESGLDDKYYEEDEALENKRYREDTEEDDRREKEDSDLEARRNAEDEELQKQRDKEDAELDVDSVQERHSKEYEERMAAREKEDEELQKQRESEDEEREQKRSEEDEADDSFDADQEEQDIDDEESAINEDEENLKSDREDEDAETSQKHDDEDEADIASREEEEKQRYHARNKQNSEAHDSYYDIHAHHKYYDEDENEDDGDTSDEDSDMSDDTEDQYDEDEDEYDQDDSEDDTNGTDDDEDLETF